MFRWPFPPAFDDSDVLNVKRESVPKQGLKSSWWNLQVFCRSLLLDPDQVVLNISQTNWLLLNYLEPLDQRGRPAPVLPSRVGLSSTETFWSSSSCLYTRQSQEWSSDRSGLTGWGRGYLSGRVVAPSPAAPVHPPGDSSLTVRVSFKLEIARV